MEETEGKQTEMGPALFEDCENASDEHLHMSSSDATGQPFATGSIRDAASPQTFIKEEISAAMGELRNLKRSHFFFVQD